MRRARLAAVGVVVLAAGGAIAAIPGADAQAPSGPRFGENFKMPPLGPTRARDVPGLAVDPSDANHIVEVDGDAINLNCDFHASFDGGQTWSGGHLTVANPVGTNPPFPSPACVQNFDSGGYHHLNTSVAFGTGQNVYVAFSVHRGPFNRPESNGGNSLTPPGSDADGGNGDDAVVAHSTDGGRTFAPATVAVPGGGPVSANLGLAGQGMRPQLAVQTGAGTGGADRLYIVSWHCYIKPRASSFPGANARGSRGGCSGGGGERRILAARSDNGGTSWSTHTVASAVNVRSGTVTPPNNIPAGTGAAAEAGSTDEQAREPSLPVIGPDGAVYVAYRNRDITDGTTCPVNPSITANAPGGFTANKSNCIVVARSTNQGATWQQFSTNVPVSSGTLSNPRLAIDRTTPVGTGTLYLVYQRPPFSGAMPPTANNNDTDIVLQKSTDAGQTWSPVVRVNDDTTLNVTQTNPSVSVGTAGVDVIWADRRNPYPGASQADMYFARSTNGGTSFGPNRRVTDRTINIDVGRYNDLGSQFSSGFSWYGPTSAMLPGGKVLAAWQDSREGSFDTGFQDIYLSRFDPGAPIGTKRTATATGAGLSVALSRLAYPGGPEAVGGSGGDPVSRPVVANEGDPAAALAGAALARANWAPLYLSPAGGLPAVVKADAARIHPEGGYVVGGTAQLSPVVSQDLTNATRDGEGVVRVSAGPTVAGANRNAEIARKVAELMRPLPGGASPEAVIANPDSLAAGSAAGLAGALKLPMLFVDNRAGSPIPPPTSAAITSLGIKKVLIVGGTDAVNAATETSLVTLLGAPNVKRVGGADQYATSEAVLAESRLRGLPSNVVYVADGARPIDGAVVGSAVARLGGLVLLRPGADAASAETRLTALGIDAAVDRIVAAIGTGGTDPAVAAAPRPPAVGYPVPIARLSLAGCPGGTSRGQIALTNGNDTRSGTALADLIFAGAGNDVIDALGGNDCVDLGPGADRGQGGAGNDFVQAGLGNDTVRGGSGRDRLRGFTGNDRLLGDSGNDSITGNSGRDSLSGNSGRDALNGGSGGDRLNGGSGRDRITASSGNDRITANDGSRDRINCGSGRDRVTADTNDTVAHNCETVRRR